MGTKHKKLSSKDKVKIQARFNIKYQEFIKLPLNDEVFEGVATKRGLKTIYKEDKMSSTDRKALIQAINYVLYTPKKKEGVDRIDELMEKSEKQDE